MSTDTQTPHRTIKVDPENLADHPLLAHIPVWAKDSEEFKSLRESIRADGQLYEILVDSENRVVDGRNRRNALAALRRDAVCRVVPEAEVSTIIFRTLMQRRHVSSGIRAFLAVPLVQPLIEAALRRKTAIAKEGGTISAPCGDGLTIDRIALDCGVSRDTFDRARKAHKLLDALEPEVRAIITGRLLNEEIELSYVPQVIQNYTKNPTKVEGALDARRQFPRLFEESAKKLPMHWEKATPEQRAEIAEKLRTEVATWPEELLRETQLAIKAAMKLQQGGAVQ